MHSFTLGTVEDFTESFEKHKQFLKFDMRLQLGGRTVVRRETADAQKCRSGQDNGKILLDCVLFQRKSGSFYIGENIKFPNTLIVGNISICSVSFAGTTTSIQLPQEYVNMPIHLTLEVSVVIPESIKPTNHRAHMSSEEMALRAMLEGGRYRVPKIEPIALSLPIVVIDSLQVECWSKATSPWSALLGVELSNMHPHLALQIQNVEVNLPASLSVYDNPLYDHTSGDATDENPPRLYSPCFPPVQQWLDAVPLPAAQAASTPTPALIASGETLALVFKVSQKRTGRHMTSMSACCDGSQCWDFAQSLRCAVPPPTLSGDFVSPVDIRWREVPPHASLDTPECVRGAEMGTCAGNFNFMQSTAPVYWELERREGNEFVVDISGPKEGRKFQPLTLQVIILLPSCQLGLVTCSLPT